ncbi:MAG: adenylyltransferase/cytidyltransferase family protein [Candidatus Paceibacterota bacterium]
MINLPAQIIRLVEDTKEKDDILVLVTGVFDVLHKEHRHFLQVAKKIGDVLLVGIESDRRVKAIKGVKRPINSQEARKAKLKLWRIADEVFILPEDFHLQSQREELIRILQPDILAVSSHTKHLKEKARAMGLVGGELRVIYQHNPLTSSTKLINHQ